MLTPVVLILSGFNATIKQLEELAGRNHAKVAENTEKARQLAAESDALEGEATQAERTADRIKDLLG
ncbi:hypothetical protein TMS3_0116375 [Pseudomonas taeanensis MS-3]|uniref:Uncharacterized protein n=1 Tax=Pseudomonas taeanensis MS-3 TaxID=1395571 RepID=A0A0A1YGN7_9PSED|nr:hypothetical protein [Pseudomonas taeanensis]KFX69055.1 hypothetical protein TMS3_0116375 [Pseudomonas taeanensis MS-3]